MENISRDLLKSKTVTKEILVEMLLGAHAVPIAIVCQSRSVLRSTCAKFDDHQSELVSNQKCLIQAQQDLIVCQNKKLDVVGETVQKEVQSFSDVVKKNCSVNNSVTPAKLKRTLRTAIVDEKRPKNFLILGADEDLYLNNDEQMEDEDLVEEIFSSMYIKDHSFTQPDIEQCSRVGVKKSSGAGRPIKVTLRSPDAVREVLSRAKRLKSIIALNYSFKFNRLFLSPDRTEEERKARKKPVQEMRTRILEDSNKRYFIKEGKVMAEDP